MIFLQCVSNREEIKKCYTHASRYLCRIAGVDLPIQTLLAYELPDPLNLRLEVTEDTGAKIHGKTLRETSRRRLLIQFVSFRYQIVDPGATLRTESSWFHLFAVSV